MTFLTRFPAAWLCEDLVFEDEWSIEWKVDARQ